MSPEALLDRLDELDASPVERADGTVRCAAFYRGGSNASAVELRPDGYGGWHAHDYADPSYSSEDIAYAIRSAGPLSTNGARPERRERPAEPLPTADELTDWQRALTLADELPHVARALNVTGWSERVARLVELGIGWNGYAFEIPARDASGELVNVTRYQPEAGPGRKARARRGHPRALFPAPESVEGERVYVVEGEPDAITATLAGLPAVAVPGADQWRDEWAQRFDGREVVVCMDADEAGRKGAQKISRSLTAHGVRHAVVDLAPDRRDGFDVKALAQTEGFEAAADRLRQLAQDALPPADGLHFIDASDVRQEPQHALLLRWGQRVPAGAVTALLGRAGRGKTMLACLLASEVSRGGLGQPPRSVLFLSSEDSASMIAARLEAAGADMARVKILSHVQHDGRREGFRLPRDGAHLERAVRIFEPALIVLGGSLMSHVAAGLDSHRQTDMRAVIEPLHDVAERHGCAVLAVVHPNKARYADPGHAITGSTATYESVRSALLLEREDDDETALVLAHFKHNNSPKEESLTFRLEEVELPSGVRTARLLRTGTSELSAVELLSAELKRTSGEGRTSKREQAKDLLRVLLDDHEPHRVSEVKAALASAGISERTAERASAELAVTTTHDDNVPPVHFWTMPSPFIRVGGTGTGGTGETPETPMNTGDSPLSPVQSRQVHGVGGTGAQGPFNTKGTSA